jgi:hypothetical protein
VIFRGVFAVEDLAVFRLFMLQSNTFFLSEAPLTGKAEL